MNDATDATKIIFDEFYFGADLVATISGQTITVPAQTLNTVAISGSGSINNAATQITLTLSFNNFLINETCTLTYTFTN